MPTKKASATPVVAEPVVKAVKATKTSAKTKTANTAPAPEAKKAVAEKVAKKAAPVAKTVKKAATVKVEFVLPKEAAENAQTVSLLGDFNFWKEGVSLKKQKDGSFSATVELEKGRSYEYRFLINGEKWENAWNAEAYKPTPFGTYNSVITA